MLQELATGRSIPPEWPNLLELAADAVPQNGTDFTDTGAMRTLGQALVPLGSTALDNNAFYAYSLTICNIAQGLRDPQSRKEIVRVGTAALLAKSQQMGGGISGILEMPKYLETAFGPIVRRSYEQRPLAERLAGEFALAASSQRRQIAGERLGQSPDLQTMLLDNQIHGHVLPRMNRELFLKQSSQDFGISLDHREPAMETNIRKNIVHSAAYIAFLILREKTLGLAEGALPDTETRELLRHHSAKRAAQESCAVTSPEFFGELGPILSIGATDVQFVDPHNGHRPKTSTRMRRYKYGSRGRPYFERDEAIVCPAGGVRGMAPLALDLVARMVDEACEQLAA